MRRFDVVALATGLVLAQLVAAAGGAASAPKEGDEREAFWYEHHLEMVARAQEHAAAGSALVPVLAAGPSAALATVEDVQEISRWTIDGPGQDDTETEPDIATDPNNPSRITAVFQQGRFSDFIAGAAAIGFSTSHDDGTTWTNGTLPGLTETFFGPYERATDPVVAFGPDGSVYANTLFFNADNSPNGVAVSRSDDGGLTWNPPTIVQSDGAAVFNDKNWIALDTYPGSPFLGRMYVAWTRFGIQLKYSDDRGQTWSSLKTVDASGIGAIPVVQPNGVLTVVYLRGGSAYARTSTDGGNTFEPRVEISSLLATEPPDMRTGGLPSAAVDPLTGHLYAAWQDTRFRSDGLNDIVLSRSTDGGGSWSPVVKITPGQSGDRIDHFTPDVAAFNHLVYVTYRNRNNLSPATQRFVGMALVLSSDDGLGFGPEKTLRPRSDLDHAALASGTLKFLGDYMGVAAIGTEAHAAWNRSSRAPEHPTGPHQTTWSATILAP